MQRNLNDSSILSEAMERNWIQSLLGSDQFGMRIKASFSVSKNSVVTDPETNKHTHTDRNKSADVSCDQTVSEKQLQTKRERESDDWCRDRKRI